MMLNRIMINLMMLLKKDSGAGFEKLNLNSLMKSLEKDVFLVDKMIITASHFT